MENTLELINQIIAYGLDVFIFVIMYLSIKNSFFEERKGKISSFFLTLIIYPLPWYIISMFSSSIIVGVIYYFNNFSPEVMVEDRYFFVLVSCVGSVEFILMILVCLFIGILWLRFKNIAPFIYLYTMFLAIIVTNVDNTGWSFLSIPYLGSIFNLFRLILGFFIVWSFYRLVVLKYSELIKDGSKINWKLFIAPPLTFSLIYAFFSYLISSDYKNDVLNFFGSIFALIIIGILVWAFYVILKNMIATNEAIKAKNEIKTLSVEVMEALAHTIDAKDEYTKGHSVRVAKYSRMLAERLGLTEGDCESVYYMALLHDIGKIGVPNEIINSKSKMTDEEYAKMKTHPGIGSDILEEIKSRPDLMIGARWHHERYDGKGYPDQKAGEDIPYFARIISVADSYDAMTSNRSYRNYLPQDVVRGEIEKNSGTQFDPNVAKCMLSIIDEDVNYEYHE